MPEMVLAQIGNALPQLLQNMESMGFFLYLFPFLLSLAIFYGIFSTFLKERMEKSAISLLSIVLAFFVMLFSSWNPAIVTFFTQLSGTGLIVASGILFFILILGMAGYDIKDLFAGKMKWPTIFVLLFVGAIIFFGAGAGSLIPLPSWSTSGQLWSAIFFIVIVALAMWWMGSNGGEKK